MPQLVENINALQPARAATERMEQARSFWKQQVHTRGRTGWADPVVYAYDQLDRLERIKQEISRRPVKGGKALDFGCGPGDFSKLLLSMGFKVCAYDPFVTPQIRSGAFCYANQPDQICFRNHAADLALSITTLDHILDENDLLGALATIRDCLKPGADFYMIEYALDSETDRDEFGLKNHYQSFRALGYWKELLAKSSFRVLNVTPVAHPFISPSPTYSKYAQSGIVRLIGRYRRLPVSRLLLRQYAARLITKSPAITPQGASPIKLIHSAAV